MKIRRISGYLETKDNLYTNFFGNGMIVLNWIQLRILKDILRKFSSQITGKMLDIGCGDAPYRILFKEVSEYEGMDFPATKKFYKKQKFPMYWGDIASASFSLSKKYDVIGCFEVLEHVNDPKQAVANMNKLLSKGGLCIITTPFLYNSHMQPYNYFHFTKFGLFALAEQNGFTVEYYRPKGDGYLVCISIFYNLLSVFTIGVFEYMAKNKTWGWLGKTLSFIFVVLIELLFLPFQIPAFLLEFITEWFYAIMKKTPFRRKYEDYIRSKQALGQVVVLKKIRDI